MPLKRKKEAEEAKKNQEQGGDELDPEQIRSIVEQVLDEKKEKGELSQEMGELRKGIKDANEGLAGLKRLFCTEDGKICFPTQADLDAYMEKQARQAKELDGKITEIASQVKTLKPSTSGLPEGVKVLEPMTEEKRNTFTEEQNLARDALIAQNNKVLNQSTNDQYRQMKGVDKDRIANKSDIRQKVFDSVTDEERKKVVVFACKDGVCKPFREDMEKKEGVKFYVKDERGRFIPADQPERKPDVF